MEMKKKVLLSTFVIFIVGLIAYITIPFSRFEQIHIWYQDFSSDQKTKLFLDRLWAYNHFRYVHKGASFNELQCYSKEGGRYTVSIKFNWDNTITVSENEQEITLNIDSIDFEPELCYGVVPDFNNDDYFFESISFFDTKQMCCDSLPSSIALFRQTKALLNGPHRYGFELYINNHKLSTGNEQKEHIFED